MCLRERSRHSSGAKQVTLVVGGGVPKGLCKHLCKLVELSC